ncbi:MAG TPA: Stk1 family PASTA domain-containing Ser/Thr kinase, partial [Acidimicrobiales bacterium]|nr:Stk1 family PASTA domain-containing Ser/Thr kinase [Acidimicrobiales bacterium]
MASQVFTGRYQIVRHLARGGMAEVYLARDLLLDRPVALKVLFPEFATDRSFVERFRREARSAANLNHPNIVSIYDWGEEEGTYFIVMEYVDGLTLRDVIRRQGPLLASRAAEIGADIAAALHFAHVGGVVHRDVKPGNVLITASQVKVTDFGIARAGDPAESLTQAGAVMGTATYFSPEQAQGHVVDPRTDVYSLGVVLYEMVAGRPPFTGDNPVSIAYQHVREEPVPPSRHNPDVPPAFDAIIAKAMAKNRANRYSSAEELRADLIRFNLGQPVSAVPAPPPAPAPAPPVGAATSVMTGARAGPAPEPTLIQSRMDGTRVVTPGDTMIQYADDGPRARTSVYIIILVVLLAMLGTLLVLVGRQLGVGGTEEVTVPQLIGRPVADAEAELRSAGLKFEKREVPDEVNPVGQVTGQDPLANTKVRKGATVIMSVSAGAPIVEVPDVRNKTADQATEALTAAGFRVVPNLVNSDTKEPNTVIDQAPAAGTRQPKGSNITLTISKGVEQIVVPNVRGLAASDAANRLGQAGFRTTQRTEFSSDFSQGEVIRTEPASGTPLDKNSVVTLIVSSGPAPTTTQAPVTTTTVAITLPTITIFPTSTST